MIVRVKGSLKCEQLHGNGWIARVKELVAAGEFGVGLFEKRTEELVLVTRIVTIDELVALVHRQPVVDDHVHPFAELPEAEVEYARVAHVERLIGRYDELAEVGQHGQSRESRQEPAIARVALHQIVRVYVVHDKS